MRKQIAAELQTKDKEIDELQKLIDERGTVIKSMSEKETDHRDKVKALFAERDALREQINDKIKEKSVAREAFWEKNNAFFDYQRAVREQRKMKYEEEKRRIDEEKAEYLKKLEEEEMKKVPYEAEQALCEYLAKYLTTTYLDQPNKTSGDGDDEAGKKNDFVAVSDDPFANFKPVSKKDDEVYLKMGEGKKPRERKSKKNKKLDKSARFKLNMDTFEQFGLIGLVPPTTLEEVPHSVNELQEKKNWYSKQARGSVATASEIRKQNEKAAAKVRGTGDGHSTSNGKARGVSGSGNFSLSTDDFAPLTGGGTGGASFNSSWGQKDVAPLVGDDDEAVCMDDEVGKEEL